VSEPTTPLQIPDYRRYWVSRFFAVSSTLSMVVLIGYQTYDVARADYGMSIRDASFLLGLLGLAQFVPLFLLTPVAGYTADRFDRRKVAATAHFVDIGIALAIAILTWRDAVNLPILFALAAAHGTARVFGGPALSAIAPNIVPPALLPRAVALGSIAYTGGSVAGPAVGGLMFAAHPALPYFVSAGLLACSVVLVLSVRPIRPPHRSDIHPLRQMIEGLTFTWRDRFLLGCISLDLFAVILAGATALLPVFARDILHVGSEGLGFMRAAPAAGAGLVALYLAFRPLEHNVGAKMLWAVAIFGAATIAFGFSRNYLLSLGLLALLGASDMVSVFVRSSLVQLNTPDAMRGRVSSISGLAISASNELGEMQSGIAAAILGATGAVVFGGAGAIVITAIWAWIFPELRLAKTFAPQYRQPDPTTGDPGLMEKLP
jgi:MFS family permease